MNLVGIAQKTGMPSASLTDLLAGTVRTAVAAKLKTTSSVLQDFLDGKTALSMAQVVGCSSETLTDLRTALGKEGAIGMLLGMCLATKSEGF